MGYQEALVETGHGNAVLNQSHTIIIHWFLSETMDVNNVETFDCTPKIMAERNAELQCA